VSGFGEPAIADINVVAHQGADLGDLRGVHCGQGEDESRGWGGSCGDGAVDLVSLLPR
jgi:hypothetical protein